MKISSSRFRMPLNYEGTKFSADFVFLWQDFRHHFAKARIAV